MYVVVIDLMNSQWKAQGKCIFEDFFNVALRCA
jgi:hypothetical protein